MVLGFSEFNTRQSIERLLVPVRQIFADNTFIVHCLLPEQSRLLFEAKKKKVDKTFKRTECDELEINIYSEGKGDVRSNGAQSGLP